MADFARLALLAQHAAMTDHHLGHLAQVARPIGHELPAPFEETCFPAWERAMVGQVRRAAHCANEFLDLLAEPYAGRNQLIDIVNGFLDADIEYTYTARDPISTDSDDTVRVCNVCGDVEGHHGDCAYNAALRLTGRKK